MISVEEQARLSHAVRDVEALTAGEIVVVIAQQADAHRSVPIIWALLAALVTPWPLIWFTQIGPNRIFMIQLLVALVLSIGLAWPRIHLALVPGFIKRARAHEAAMREFMGRGLTRTRERTGILIYVAAAEHYAEIVADIGIADRVGPEIWQEIIADLLDAIRAGQAGDGLVKAVRRAGAILAEHAPPRLDDMDELPNKVILM
jgi:putative membrane protein